MGDEVSALVRTNYDNLSDLIRYGVKENDMHPAGVQLFMYGWTKLFGYGEFIVRLPFVMASIVSIFMSYKIASKWFSAYTGLITAAFIAGLEYFIVYGEIARPYSPGLMLTLIVVWYWSKIALDRDTRPSAYFFFALSCIAGMYTHYYCFMFLGIIGISGFLFIPKSKLKPYLITGVGICLMYIPHIAITQYQMDTGGLHGWLGPPDKFWLLNYTYLMFNDSWMLLAFLWLILVIVGFYQIRFANIKKLHFLALFWFSVAFLFGFIYSRTESPILQPNVMIFAAPFLIMVLADLLNASRYPKALAWIPILVLGATSASTIIERSYFTVSHFGVIEELITDRLEYEESYGQEIPAVANVSGKAYIDFYKENKGYKTDFLMYSVNSEADWDSIYSYAANSNSNLFYYAWSARSNSQAIYEMLSLLYPNIIEDRVYQNARTTLFSKKADYAISYPVVKTFEFDLDGSNPYIANHKHTLEDHPKYGKCIHLKPNVEFAYELQIPFKDLSLSTDHYISFSFEILDKENSGSSFVYEVNRDNQLLKAPDDSDAWFGKKLGIFNLKSGWNRAVHARKIDPYFLKEDVAKLYFWNPNKGDIYIRNFVIQIKQLPKKNR